MQSVPRRRRSAPPIVISYDRHGDVAEAREHDGVRPRDTDPRLALAAARRWLASSAGGAR